MSTTINRNESYLNSIKYFRMVDSNRISWNGVLGAQSIKDAILPVTWLRLPISKCIHPKSLPSSLMPGSFIAMTISKTINTKSMHLVCKILSSIGIAISTHGSRISVKRRCILFCFSFFLHVHMYQNQMWRQIFNEKNIIGQIRIWYQL